MEHGDYVSLQSNGRAQPRCLSSLALHRSTGTRYNPSMVRRALLPIILMTMSAPAIAAQVVVVNATGSSITALSVRPYGAAGWQPVDGALSVGARRSISGQGEACAFDIRGKLAGGAEVTWSGVNFCETKVVTLNRRPDGTTWADYD
jgi:hypothetical protein